MPMSALEIRLASQLAARGQKNSKDEARRLLKERGHVDAQGNLTKLGRQRQAMGADGRAKDRAARASNGRHKPADYDYDPKTNLATLK